MTKYKQTPTTTRKAKIIGTKQYIDAETGDIINCQVAEIEERDSNFTKFWLGNILAAIDEISNAKMKLLSYLLREMDYYNNTLLKTVQEIADESKVSKRTVIDTLSILEKYNIIRRKTGVVFLNPDILFKGGVGKRRAILLRYMDVPNRLESKEAEEENSEHVPSLAPSSNSTSEQQWIEPI